MTWHRLVISESLGRAWLRLSYKKKTPIVFLYLLFLAPAASAQFKPPSPACDLNDSLVAAEADLAMRSIEALKRLERLTPVQTTGGESAKAKVTSVPFEVFKKEFESVLAEIEPLLCQLPQNKLKVHIVNALYSYRDGLFWLNKIDQPRVVDVAALSYQDVTQTPADAAYSLTIPSTIAAHWRHASKYLKRAQDLLNSTVP